MFHLKNQSSLLKMIYFPVEQSLWSEIVNWDLFQYKDFFIHLKNNNNNKKVLLTAHYQNVHIRRILYNHSSLTTSFSLTDEVYEVYHGL